VSFAASSHREGAPGRLGAPALELRSIGKSFGNVRALTDVSLSAYAGEIHAIVGDNGAGKSTTLKVMCGIHRGDSGEMFVGGSPIVMHDPSEAQRHGIAVVHQDLALVECLDIATNMSLGAIPRRARFFLDRGRMESEAAKVLDDLRIRVGSVRTQIGLLSGGERQIVAVARAVRLDLPIMLLDEPTAALGVRETAHVGEILRDLRVRGKTILCISHDFDFVFRHADRITVMRLGNSIATRRVEETSRDEIVGLITGAIKGTSSELEHQP
jgi:ABC-type sugar transport system ATPase subunit